MNRNSFTLIELVVVMAVIAILVGAALPRIKGMQDEANISKSKTELKTLQAGLESFYTNRSPNSYPASGSNLCEDALNSASPLIVNQVVYDPFRSGLNEYTYFLSDNDLYYAIFSYGVNSDADITGIGDDGFLTGADEDDVYVTNGLGFAP